MNQPVFAMTGRLLGFPDLLDIETGLVVEYDGDDHRSAKRHSRDVQREAAFRDHGLEVTRLTGIDVREPARAIARLQAARDRAARNIQGQMRSQKTKKWTTVPPTGFVEERPLDLDLDLLSSALIGE